MQQLRAALPPASSRYVVMTATTLFLIVVAALTVSTDAACTNQPNLNPIYRGALKLVKTVPNGKLYLAGWGEDSFYVAHVYGEPFEWGRAEGLLLKDEMTYIVSAFFKHLETELEAAFPDMPQMVKDFIAEYGLAGALDLTYEATWAYTPTYFYDELHGIANATGIPYGELLRMHMLPELIQAACSMFGAWGRSTPTGSLYQLRALDWDTSGPLQTYPVVTVYHPNKGNGHAFANVGWAGWIGSMTGFSSSPLGISEKVGDNFGETSRFGIPWYFMLRDILQYDVTLDDAITRMANAKRTCNVYFGVGDGYQRQFRLFEYGYAALKIYDPINTPFTPRLPDIVYRGVNQDCFSSQLNAFSAKKNVTAINTVQSIVPQTGTGDLLAAVYDFDGMLMYVSNAAAANETGPRKAYQRTFTELNMRALFSETY